MRNKVTLIGNLGQDPQVINLDGGKKMVKLSLATNELYTSKLGIKTEDTQWHKLVVWGKTADVAQRFLKKGSEVAVEGKITYHNYTDKKGEKRYFTEINVSDIVLLGSAA